MIPQLTWPDDTNEVECVGFSQELVYNLIVALDHKRVEYVSKESSGSYVSYTFDYLGFRYVLELEEFQHVRANTYEPYRLQKIARLGVDDDGETIVEEHFIGMGVAQPTPERFEQWGEF
jgi:hypothetical protein